MHSIDEITIVKLYQGGMTVKLDEHREYYISKPSGISWTDITLKDRDTILVERVQSNKNSDKLIFIEKVLRRMSIDDIPKTIDEIKMELDEDCDEVLLKIMSRNK